MNELITGNTISHWKSFYKTSGMTTIILMVFFLFDTACWVSLGQYPSSAEGWFSLLQQHRSTGLLLLSLPTFFGTILYFLTFLSLFNILKKVNTAYAALATIFAFVGLSVLLATHMAYPIISLSEKYAVITTDIQRTLLLAAGEMRIQAAVTGTYTGGFLAEAAALIFSLLMLKSDTFGRITAYLGIVGHGFDLARISMSLALIPEKYGAVLLVIGGLPQLIWLVLVGIKFLQVGRGQSVAEKK
jgi:hypothetical protein